MKDLTARKFARWTVLSYKGYEKPHRFWLCRCECGEEKIVQANSLLSGTSKSCGCLRTEKFRKRVTSHGESGTPLYKAWAAMRARCLKKNGAAFKHYGGRGIQICKRWDDFENFALDMGPSYEEGLTLERVNVDGDYKPSNCKWIPKSKQAWNRTDTVYVDTIEGRMTIIQAAKRAGVSRGAMAGRIANQWPIELLLVPAYSKN